MKKFYIPILVLVAVLAAGVWFLTKKAEPVNTQVNNQITNPATIETVIMKEDGFDPETITIKKGSTVIFKNEDQVARWPASNLHPTHGIYPEFDPQRPLESGQSWSFTFDKVGEWKYHDHLIPSIRGKILVTE